MHRKYFCFKLCEMVIGTGKIGSFYFLVNVYLYLHLIFKLLFIEMNKLFTNQSNQWQCNFQCGNQLRGTKATFHTRNILNEFMQRHCYCIIETFLLRFKDILLRGIFECVTQTRVSFM